MVTYRNTKTGATVTRHEPDPALENVTRWQRVEDAPPAPREPRAADVREWARGQGLDVPQRGKLPPEVIELYKAHNAPDDHTPAE